MDGHGSPAADTRAHHLGALLAGGLPLLLWLATASAFPEGRPGAQAAALRLELSPPLWAVWAKLCSLLPLGPLSLRTTLASSLATAMAAAAAYRTLSRVLKRFSPTPAATSLLALGVSLSAVGQPTVFALGAVAEPHALSVALVALCAERWSAYYLQGPRRSTFLSCLLLAALSALQSPWLGIAALCPLLTTRFARAPQDQDTEPSRLTAGHWLAWVSALTALLLGLLSLRYSSLAQLERSPYVGDELDALLRRPLPQQALLLVGSQTAGRLADAESEQHTRPDLQWLRLTDFERANGATQMAAERPELAPLLREWLLEGELPVASLQSLAATRPLLLELEPARIQRARHELLETLEPSGLLLRVSSSALLASDIALAAERQGQLRTGHADLTDPAAGASETLRSWLGERLRAEALYYRLTGDKRVEQLLEDAKLSGVAASP